MIVFSFNNPTGKFNYTWQGFTWDNWRYWDGVPGIRSSIVLSLEIALLASLVATALGTLIALALVRYGFRGRGVDQHPHLPAALDARDRARRLAPDAVPEPERRLRLLDDPDRPHHVLHQLRGRDREGAPDRLRPPPRGGGDGPRRQRVDDLPQGDAAADRAGDPGRAAALLRDLDRRLRRHLLQLRQRGSRSRSSSGAPPDRRAAAGERDRHRDLRRSPDRDARQRPRPDAALEKEPHDHRLARALARAAAAGRARPPLAALHAHGRLPRRRGADHRPRRRLLPRGRERQALPRRARRPVRGADRLLVRRGDRRGGGRADARAALLHELVVRAPARDRARGRGGVARARRPEPRLLRLRRLRGGRVGLEARAPVLLGARRAPRGVARIPAHPSAPTHDFDAERAAQLTGERRWKAISRHVAYHGTTMGALSINGIPALRTPFEPLVPEVLHVRNTNRYHRPPEETEEEFTRFLLDELEQTIEADGPGDGLHGDHGAGAERRRRVHAARGLLARRARALRPLRDPALRRRGDHRLRPPRHLVRLRALRHPARHRHLRQGSLVGVRVDRRGDRDRPGDGAVPARASGCTRTGSRSAAIRSRPRSR